MVHPPCDPRGSRRALIRSVRKGRHEDLQHEEHDERREVEPHTADAHRREQIADGSENRLGESEQEQPNGLERAGAARREPAENDPPEKGEQEDLQDEMYELPEHGVRSVAEDRGDEATTFVGGNLDADG